MLRNQRPEFDAKCDDEEKPVEKDNAVRIAKSSMLEPLDLEYDAQGYNREDAGPESEIGSPYVRIANNLDN